MQLPIDASRRPFRAKYLESETHATNSWFIFGEYPDGTVGISDGNDDVFSRVPKDMAERIVTARNTFVAVLLTELG